MSAALIFGAASIFFTYSLYVVVKLLYVDSFARKFIIPSCVLVSLSFWILFDHIKWWIIPLSLFLYISSGAFIGIIGYMRFINNAPKAILLILAIGFLALTWVYR